MPKTRKKRSDFKRDGVEMCSPYFEMDKIQAQSSKAQIMQLDKQVSQENHGQLYQPQFQFCQRKPSSFFNQECLYLARSLLGKVVVRQVDGKRLAGVIAETECYLGNEDIASHSFGGKRTPRNEPMYMKSGTSYVYSIYGMYHCFNISSKEDGSCVLIRALEPTEGIDEMQIYRRERRKIDAKPLKHHQLCNGPSKLCQALNIRKENCNKIFLPESQDFWLEDGRAVEEGDIVVSKRIGIDSAGEEWANKPLRFYILDNPSVSIRDKKAEVKMKHLRENIDR